MVQEFAYKEHSFKLLDHVEYAKSGFYLRKLEQELDYLEKEKAEIEKRLKFLYKQKRAVVKYRLQH